MNIDDIIKIYARDARASGQMTTAHGGAMMNTILTHKKCKACGEIKPVEEFYFNVQRNHFHSECKACNIKRSHRWLENNPEKAKKRRHEHYLKNKKYYEDRAIIWHKNHPEYAKAYHKEYNTRPERREIDRLRSIKFNAEHPKERNERDKRYRQSHPDHATRMVQNRRALKLKIGGVVTQEEWDNLKEKYGNKCLCCGKTDIKLTMDHVVPLFVGGLHEIDNIQPLCLSCNSKKHIKIIDYRPSED